MVMRKMRENMKPILWIAIIGFLGTIVFAWGMSYSSSGGGCEAETVVLVVNGEEVPAYEYDQLFRSIYDQEVRQAQQQYGPLYHPALNDQIAQQVSDEVIEALIQEYVVRQRAAEWGLTVTDGEIDEVIMATPYFQDEKGTFSPEAYRDQLDRIGTTDEEYRRSLRRDMLVRKVYSIITDTVFPPEPMVRMEYLRSAQQADCDVVVVPAGDFQETVEVGDAEVKEYYEEHADDFMAPAVATVDYLALEFDKLYDEIELTEDHLRQLYDRRKDDYIHARHILFEVPAEADEAAVEEARQRAEQAVARLDEGADFAELAVELSEGPSAPEGGDLGFFRRSADPQLEGPAGRQMVEEFTNAAFALDPGAYTSEPVRTEFGWHLILREPDEVAFEDIANALEHELRMDQTLTAIDEYVEMMSKDLERGRGLEEIAETIPTAEVKRVENLSEDAMVINEELGTFIGFRAAAFGLEEPGEQSGIIARDYRGLDQQSTSLKRDYFILRLVERTEAAPAPLEDVRARVESAVVREKAAEAARQAAEELLTAAGQSDLETAAAAAGFDVQRVTGATRSGSLPGIGSAPKAAKLAFELENGELSDVVEDGESFYIVRGLGVGEPSPEGYGAELDAVRKRLMLSQRNPFFQAWVEELVATAEVENRLPELMAEAAERRAEMRAAELEDEEEQG
jgi:peptidyl-prolyl cis-trans isomerase D